MKRAITEWGMVFSLVLLVAIGLGWIDYLYLHYFREPLYLGNDLFVRIDDCRVCLFSELGDDWKPNVEDLQPRARSWVRAYRGWAFPGLEYHSRLFANGRTVWSLEVALVFLACVLATIIAILWRVRLGGWLPRNSDKEH